MLKRLYRWQFINIVISWNCYYVSFYVLCSVTVSVLIINHVRKVTIIIMTSSIDVKRVINSKIYCSKLERKKDSKFFSNAYSLELWTSIFLFFINLWYLIFLIKIPINTIWTYKISSNCSMKDQFSLRLQVTIFRKIKRRSGR